MTLVGQGSRILIQVVSVVVLARLLNPHDYGLMAMVLVVVGVGEIFRDFGLSSAAVQAPRLSRGQRDNLFWINVGIGILLALTTVLAAPLLAAAFRQPELTGLARVLSITFVLNGIATQFRADRVRHLAFGTLAASDVVSSAVGLSAGIVGALLGWSYWALAAQQLTMAAISMLIVVIASRFLPRLPDRTAPMSGLLRFGWHLVGTQLLGYAANNIDSVIVGARFGAHPLGIYNRGYQLLMQPLSLLRAPSTTVALPVLSRLQDDEVRYAQFIVRGQQALGYTLVAGLGIVAGASSAIVAVFLGPQWTETTDILRFFAAAGAFQTLAYVGYWVYLSRGLTSALFRYTLVSSAIRVVCILTGSIWGIHGVAAGFALAPAIAWPLSLWWLSRLTPLPVGRLIAGALRMLGLTIVIGIACFATTLLPIAAVWQLVSAIAAAGVVYAAFLAAPAYRTDIRGVAAMGRLIFQRRGKDPASAPFETP